MASSDKIIVFARVAWNLYCNMLCQRVAFITIAPAMLVSWVAHDTEGEACARVVARPSIGRGRASASKTWFGADGAPGICFVRHLDQATTGIGFTACHG